MELIKPIRPFNQPVKVNLSTHHVILLGVSRFSRVVSANPLPPAALQIVSAGESLHFHDPRQTGARSIVGSGAVEDEHLVFRILVDPQAGFHRVLAHSPFDLERGVRPVATEPHVYNDDVRPTE
jgi:hypothetical protein